MNIQPKRIVLDGLQVYPSNEYVAGINGVFDIERVTEFSDLMSDGSVEGNSRIDKKSLNIMIGINNNDILSYLAINQILSRPKIKLQLEYEKIGVLETNIIIENRADEEADNTIIISATMPDPYLYKTFAKEIELKVVKEGGIVIDNNPRQFPIVFNTTISGNRGELNNEGLYPTWSVVTITGACSNICVTNETTGEQMRVNVELGSDDVLIIDSRPSSRGIKINGIARPDLKDGDWLSVPSGVSTWRFDRTASSDNVSKHCKIGFREVFI